VIRNEKYLNWKDVRERWWRCQLRRLEICPRWRGSQSRTSGISSTGKRKHNGTKL